MDEEDFEDYDREVELALFREYRDVVSQFRYVVESVVVDPSVAAAVATVCTADGSRLVLPNAGPDGSDVVIDDEYTSGRSEWDMRLDADGAWRVYSSTPIGVAATEDVCGAG